jgi:lipid A 4'-phosphatase
MSYLRQPRARRVLLLFLASSVVFVSCPELDLRVSSAFFRGGRFQLAETWWARALHESVGYFVGVALAAIVGIYAFNRVSKRRLCGVDAKVVGYVIAVLLLGAGVTVNGVLKNGFGRARPRNIEQFGGSRQFTPAFVDGDECDANCSFSSGDGAGAYFAFALALALSRRRKALVAAAAFGTAVSFARIASGAHFLSDSVVSLFVMWIASDALHYYILLPRQALARPTGNAVGGFEGATAWDPLGLAAVPGYAGPSGGEAPHASR